MRSARHASVGSRSAPVRGTRGADRPRRGSTGSYGSTPTTYADGPRSWTRPASTQWPPASARPRSDLGPTWVRPQPDHKSTVVACEPLLRDRLAIAMGLSLIHISEPTRRTP